jgi:nicotinate-nucleotide pyrophosphorylase (carboxylating)
MLPPAPGAPSTEWWRSVSTAVIPQSEIDRIAAAALAEDGESDITTAATVAADTTAEGRIEYRSGGVLGGTAFANAVARMTHCVIEWRFAEGNSVAAGMPIAILRGTMPAMLRAERPMLNLLQRGCGIASSTRMYVDKLRGTTCRVLHTRKTAPGLRALDVSAVIAGGGERHRVDLSHEVMVKDNHWQALREGNLAQALVRAKKKGAKALYVEVESVQQLELACRAGATRLLIDNQQPETVRDWGRQARALSPSIEIEATGGITLENVRAYADAGADFVSIGALTHSVRAADLAIEIR